MVWESECQACADFKEFTWYPVDMRPTFERLKAPWTYMTDAERKQVEFQRPKRWFPKKGMGEGEEAESVRDHRFQRSTAFVLGSQAVLDDALGKRHQEEGRAIPQAGLPQQGYFYDTARR